MSRRVLASGGLAAALLSAVALLRLTAVPVAGQASAPTGSAPTGSAPTASADTPKTSWGDPDLQGIWTNDFETPLQRPSRYADKEFFTDAERAQLDRLRADRLAEDNRPHSRRSEQDVSGAYNAAIFLTHKHTGRRTSLIVDPPDGRIPPLTPEAKSKRDAMRVYQLALMQATDVCKNNMAGCQGGKYAPPSPRRFEPPPYYPTAAMNRADGPEDRGLSERCMAARLPDFGGAAGFYLQFVQSPGVISIFYDTGQGQGWQRVIPVTDRSHLPSTIRQWWGDSRGRWEGNTLVVDVTNFSPKSDFLGSSDNLHLIERWTRIDPKTIEYAVTVDDGTTWTKPWTIKQELSKQNDQANRIYREPRCHEGNHGMTALLAGARTEEVAFAKRRGPDPATLCTSGCGGFEVAGVGDFDLDGVERGPAANR
jgi:hypothetical protein